MSDARRILVLRGVRAFAYGFGSVLLGIYLETFFSPWRIGVLVTLALGGAAVASAALGRRGDVVGRRRAHVALSIVMAGAMTVPAFTHTFWLVIAAVLTGTIATTHLETGPFVALEQAMLPHTVPPALITRSFGRYNAVAALVGATGALAVGGPKALRHILPHVPVTQRFFLLPAALALVSAAIAAGLSPAVESPDRTRRALGRSRPTVAKLSALFAIDSLGGGFVVQTLLTAYFRHRFHTSEVVLGAVFFGTALLQAASFPVATRLAERFGLVNTMVFTHLPSNLFLIAIPLAPNQGAAVAFLLARFALSQMDVPARQSYVVSVVDPEERTAASAYTTTVRSFAQSASPLISGTVTTASGMGIPFFIGGALKALYDLLLFATFRRRLTPDEQARRAAR